MDMVALLVPRAKWPKLTDSEIAAEILVRGQLFNEMEGSQYPGSIQQDIGELQMILTERRLSGRGLVM